MKAIAGTLCASLLALAACGSDDDDPASPRAKEAASQADTGAATATGKLARRGTKVILRNSEFGRMLFGADKQAIYIFENDPRGKSVCYGDCAEAWPPVFANGRPVAGRGVRQGLLGTTRRRGGRKQVTYAGKPLYFYAHEGPGEVRCHNVDLNGGLWWVVGANGKRRP